MNKKVLIIDDDEEMCTELKEILIDEGYDVSVALDGLKGKECMEKGTYGAVILDLKLPGMTGYDVLKSAKKNPAAPKIIILSGRPMGSELHQNNETQDEEERALKLADTILNKPISVPLLLEKISQYTLFRR